MNNNVIFIDVYGNVFASMLSKNNKIAFTFTTATTNMPISGILIEPTDGGVKRYKATLVNKDNRSVIIIHKELEDE